MRALTGAIITAGALIGLGFTIMGIGNRYQARMPVLKSELTEKENADLFEIRFRELDNPMKVAVAVTVGCVIIGLGITFLGLAYHHERRHQERLHGRGHTENPRVTV